jgi:hypothetical protein
MEYLMTYGWAILIIAVVLGALFNLGVFSGASVIGTACVASPGFLCTYLTFSHTTAIISVTVGQSTGTPWTGWAVTYAPSSIPFSGSLPQVAFLLQTGTLSSGQSVIVNLPVNGLTGPMPVGTPTSGDIWICYATGSSTITGNTIGSCSGTGQIQYAQIATFTAKAV